MLTFWLFVGGQYLNFDLFLHYFQSPTCVAIMVQMKFFLFVFVFLLLTKKVGFLDDF